MDKKSYFQKLKISVVVTGLFAFMLCIFSPAETFFANASELPFVYGEFSSYLWLFAIVFVVGMSLVTAILPERIHAFVTTLLFALSVCAYIQNMFLNKGLDLMGLNPDGYNADSSKAGVNIAIWLIVLVITVILGMVKDYGKKIVTYGALFLLAIQVIAYVSLIVAADDSCFDYPLAEFHLSGEDQYDLSKDGNIVLFVVDSLSNRDLRNA